MQLYITLSISSAVFALILIGLGTGAFMRMRSSPPLVAVPSNGPPPPGPQPAPAFFAPPPGPPPGQGGFAPQANFASQAPLANGSGQFIPVRRSTCHLLLSSSSLISFTLVLRVATRIPSSSTACSIWLDRRGTTRIHAGSWRSTAHGQVDETRTVGLRFARRRC